MRFLKLIPAGDPGVNHVKMETDTPESISLVPFCRHPEESTAAVELAAVELAG